MNRPIGFLKAFFGCCSGTAVFGRLKDHPWIRIVWHTILLSFLAAVIVTGFEMNRFVPQWQRQEQVFRSAFGDRISFSDDQVIPEKAPEKNRLLPLPQDTLLAYVGTGESGVELPRKELPLVQNLIVWSASDFASARQTAPGEWLFGKCILHDGKARSIGKMTELHTEELIRNVRNFRQKNWFSAPAQEEDGRITVTVRTLGRIAAWLTGATLFLLNFFDFLFSQWILTGIYAGVFAIFNAKRLRHLTLRQFWKCGLYAGFPALAVGACWPALELPFLDFRLVYMVGLVFYWMAVIGRMERSADSQDHNGGE